MCVCTCVYVGGKYKDYIWVAVKICFLHVFMSE